MERFTFGSFSAILTQEKPVAGGPQKVFSVEWFNKSESVRKTRYEDYKLARKDAQDLLREYAEAEV